MVEDISMISGKDVDIGTNMFVPYLKYNSKSASYFDAKWLYDYYKLF